MDKLVIKNKEKIKSLFLSDIHIGCKENNLSTALDVIDHYEFENLFLVGDIIDVKELKKNWHWNKLNTNFLHKIFKISETKNVVYIQGNHERGFFEEFPKNTLPINICREYVYKDILIIHGDQFDTIIGNWKWLYSIGDFGYNLSIFIDSKINYLRRLFGYKKPIRLSKKLKRLVKDNVNYLSNFHEAAIKYCKYKKCKTIIVGHTHNQEIVVIDDISYLNIGDMRQDETYIIEDLLGNLKLINLEKENILKKEAL